MRMERLTRRLALACAFALLSSLASGGALRAEDDKGESAEMKKLKARTTAPKESDLDPAATLESLLAKKGPSDWSTKKAATLEGTLVQVEKEEDGDLHLVLASGNTTDTTKWVLAEVTPAWQKKSPALSRASLKKLVGKTVRVTGWLFLEPDEAGGDPRGTGWEIHPVSSVTAK